MKLEDALLLDTRANQPVATAVAEGTLYYVSDEGITEQSRSGSWQSYTDGGASGLKKQITLIIDGLGTVITTGIKGFISLPVSGTITKWRLLSIDAAGPATVGSIVIDIWKDTYANYPPTVADTITAAAKPTLSAVNKNEDSTLTGWTTSFSAGDILGFNVDSVSGLTKVSLTLEF